MDGRAKVIIIGGGFGGLFAAREFRGKPVDVLLIDRQNFHTFTPLLYQVATCGLEAEEIAYPLRGIFRDHPNIHFMMGEVTHLDPEDKRVVVQTASGQREEHYDRLILAAGSVTNFFQLPGVREFGYELKTLGDATRLRNHMLRAFEEAAWTEDEAVRRSLMTIVIVGGGPSGLETAGAVQELIQNVLRHEYAYLRHQPTRVILIETLDALLTAFPKSLQQSALRQLKSLGVEVMLGTTVTEVRENELLLKSGETIPTQTLIWMAGVKGSPIVNLFDLPLEPGARLKVLPTMQLEDHPDIYAVGDLSSLTYKQKRSYAQMIPPAKQQGMLAAHNIMAQLGGQPQRPFHYQDRGIMATIGRRRAVAYLFNVVPISGLAAWFAWLGLHLIALMGFRNRVNVLVNWLWNYFTQDRSVRLIFGDGRERRGAAPTARPAELALDAANARETAPAAVKEAIAVTR